MSSNTKKNKTKVVLPKQLYLTQSDEEGVCKMARLDCSSKKELSKSLFNFFTHNGKFKKDYKTEEFNISKAKNKAIIKFFKDKIENSVLDGDNTYIYQLFNEKGKSCSMPLKF